jgi:hypothetical protein
VTKLVDYPLVRVVVDRGRGAAQVHGEHGAPRVKQPELLLCFHAFHERNEMIRCHGSLVRIEARCTVHVMGTPSLIPGRRS